MRSVCFLAAIAGVLALSSLAATSAVRAEGLLSAVAGHGGTCGCDDCGGECDGGCGSNCGGKRHGLLGRLHHHRRIDGTDKAFNCGCNGSYKFPVPPLYTYHWPGMYSHQLMTDYHSPWRFPPIRPYVDEPMVDTTASASPSASLQTVSHSTAADDRSSERSTNVGSMSSLMQRIYR